MLDLANLQPEWRQIMRDRDQTPDNGGFPTGNYTLSFTCPACGPPYRISITIGATEDVKTLRWKSVPLPDATDWPSRVTLMPSINNVGAGHGRRHPTCTFHGTITNGKIAV